MAEFAKFDTLSLHAGAICCPTANPTVLITETLVDPAGTVITGPSGSGCHTVV